MKLLTIRGILPLFVYYCQFVLYGFVLIADEVNGFHEPKTCSPTDTPFAFRYQWGETEDTIAYSAILSITAACDCYNKISYFKNNNGRTGRKLDFGRFDILNGKIEYERDGWNVSPGRFYKNSSGIFTWTLQANKGENTDNHIKHDITVYFDFYCFQEDGECSARWSAGGTFSVYKNDVLENQFTFNGYPAEGHEETTLAKLTKVSGTPETVACRGDPHFTTWGGNGFDFHGECDLVLASSRLFGNGKGLDVHVRTTMVTPRPQTGMHPYSYISEAAVRVGEQILSIDRNGYWLDGIPFTFSEHDKEDSVVSLSGYPVEISNSSTKRDKFMKKFTFNLSEYGHLVTIKAAESHIDVMLDGGHDIIGNHFDDLVGLLGRHSDRAMVDRNGHLMPTNANENDLGQMWQVREWEDMIFPTVGAGPQHPTKCNLPPTATVTSAQTSRHLRSIVDSKTLNEAQLACGHVMDSTTDRDNCIFDVLATGNIDMAEFYE